jgi:cell division protein FtsA
MVELGEDVFLKQVRVASPSYRGNLADVVCTPRYATAMGLLEEARRQVARGEPVDRQTGSFRDTFQRMKSWFLGNF